MTTTTKGAADSCTQETKEKDCFGFKKTITTNETKRMQMFSFPNANECHYKYDECLHPAQKDG